jgi:hypothetical protein
MSYLFFLYIFYIFSNLGIFFAPDRYIPKIYRKQPFEAKTRGIETNKEKSRRLKIFKDRLFSSLKEKEKK